MPGVVDASGICSFGGGDRACVSHRGPALQCRLQRQTSSGP